MLHTLTCLTWSFSSCPREEKLLQRGQGPLYSPKVYLTKLGLTSLTAPSSAIQMGAHCDLHKVLVKPAGLFVGRRAGVGRGAGPALELCPLLKGKFESTDLSAWKKCIQSLNRLHHVTPQQYFNIKKGGVRLCKADPSFKMEDVAFARSVAKRQREHEVLPQTRASSQ